MASDHKNLVYDEWLAQTLGRDVYRLVVDDDLMQKVRNKEARAYELLKGLQTRPVFIYAKVSTESLATIRFLEKLGFNLIDTNVVFDKLISTTSDFVGDCLVRFAVPEDQAQVVDLARKSFIYSRFHLDSVIPLDIANTVKAEWVRNYFLGKRGEQMVVALVDEMIVGFLQLLCGDDKTLAIDLVAVDKNQRRRGISRDMIAYAETKCGEFNQVRVGTQIANVPSIRLYEKVGFRITSAQYVFHYHHI